MYVVSLEIQRAWGVARLATLRGLKHSSHLNQGAATQTVKACSACDQETDPYVEGFPEQPWKLVKRRKQNNPVLDQAEDSSGHPEEEGLRNFSNKEVSVVLPVFSRSFV